MRKESISSRDSLRDRSTWLPRSWAYLGHLCEDEDSSTFVVEGFDLDFLLRREHGEVHEIMVLFGIDFAYKRGERADWQAGRGGDCDLGCCGIGI